MDSSGNHRQRILVIGLILIGLVTVVLFGLRTARAFRQFRGHRPPPPFTTERFETDVNLIRDWMTVPFVSKMYRVPPKVLFAALEIPGEGKAGKSLRQLNDEYYPQAEGVVLEKMRAAVLVALTEQAPDRPALTATPNLP